MMCCDCARRVPSLPMPRYGPAGTSESDDVGRGEAGSDSEGTITVGRGGSGSETDGRQVDEHPLPQLVTSLL